MMEGMRPEDGKEILSETQRGVVQPAWLHSLLDHVPCFAGVQL
jgi:hypothetical protein